MIRAVSERIPMPTPVLEPCPVLISASVTAIEFDAAVVALRNALAGFEDEINGCYRCHVQGMK